MTLMRLFLLRHAHAKDTCPDEARPLSRRGVNQIKKLGAAIDHSVFGGVVEIWHSPYIRARETAEQFKAVAGMSAPLVETQNLRPEDSALAAAKSIALVANFDGDLMIVGHNPHLESLADILLDSADGAPKTAFHKCTAAMFIMTEHPSQFRPYGRWTLSFLVSACILSGEESCD